MIFIDDNHKNNYLYLAKKAKMNDYDIERKALFYIIAGNNDLFRKKNNIYNFMENSIYLNCINNSNIDLCSSSRALVRLGFNLYNGYTDEETNPLSLLYCLDHTNYFIAENAINLRLRKIS